MQCLLDAELTLHVMGCLHDVAERWPAQDQPMRAGLKRIREIAASPGQYPALDFSGQVRLVRGEPGGKPWQIQARQDLRIIGGQWLPRLPSPMHQGARPRWLHNISADPSEFC
jgi:hypothetical protein